MRTRRFFWHALTLLLALLPLVACSASATSNPPTSADNAQLSGDVRAAMVRGDWKAARQLLDERLVKAPEQSDLWLFLQGLTFQFDGQSEAALAKFTDLEARFPKSSLATKSRFQRAEILRAAARHKESEEIYESEALRLRAPERQSDLAKIYLDLADGLSTPPTAPTAETPRVDYDAAYALYAAVLELAAPATDRARARLRMSVCAEQQTKWIVCATDCERFLAAFDTASEAKPDDKERAVTAASLDDVLDVRLRLGRAQLAQDQYGLARRTFEDLVRDIADARAGRGSHAAEVAAQDAAANARLARLEGDARLRIASTYSTTSMGAPSAVAALRQFLTHSPGHPRATYALSQIAELETKEGRTEQALQALDELIALAVPAELSAAERDEDTQLRLKAYMDKGRRFLEQKRFDAAAAAFRDYAQRFPSGPDWSSAQSMLVECDYLRAQDHRANERFAEARTAWNAFLVAHPLDPRAAQIGYDIGECYSSEARSVLAKGATPTATDDESSRAKELQRAAVLEWQKLAQRFPSSEPAQHAWLEIGNLLERELNDLEGAVAAYRQCTLGSWATEALSRLTTMTRPSLALASQGVWRAGGKPRVTAQVRNQEKLRVQVYRLDLETYFKKHLTYEGIEKLDLDLIAADVTTEVAVANYKRYAPLEQAIELPFDAPGTWVVAVTAGEFRATTLVVASALDVIVKCSAREVFVFAEDVVRGIAAPNTRVLVALPAASSTRLVELTTGADGVARFALEQPITSGAAMVLALRGADVASIGLSLTGLEVGTRIESTGIVYTDRPAYRPGQVVNWRAITRDIEDGRTVVHAGEKCRVEIVDPAGRRVVRATPTLSEFGTVHDALTLDAAAPTGTYRIDVRSAKGTNFTGSFQVEAYQLQKMDLDFVFARPVVQRGEIVEAELKAAYYYGEPVTNAPLRVTLPDDTVLDLVTDAQGSAKFTFDSRGSNAKNALRFSATLLAEGVTRRGLVPLVEREYMATLRVPREVVLAGDSLEAELTVLGIDSEPLAKSMTFTLSRRESSPLGKWSEVEVSRQDVATDAKTGRVRIPVTFARGGQYTLRAETLDRFGAPIRAEASVLASGEDDDVRLRLIAADGEVEVDSKARVQVVNRSGPGLALLTLEQDNVLEYRLIEVAAGTSTVEFDLDSKAFPRVWIGIARIDRDRLREHSVTLSVVRRLDVTIEALQKSYEPGARAALRVSAKDQLGKPVRAELSIAVVDESLFDLHPDTTPSLAQVFERAPRTARGVTTASSCTFAYAGFTAKIAREVLDEERTQRERAEWAEKRANLKGDMDLLVSDNAPKMPGAVLAKNEEALEDQESTSFSTRKLGGGGAKGRAGGPTKPGASKADLIDPLPEVETAFWTATLVTNADGTATAEFDLPGQSTRWRATCRGVGPDVLVGEARTTFQSRADLFLELRTPPLLVEGDRPRFIARVHNSTGTTGSIVLKLRVEAGGRVTTLPAQVELVAAPVVECVFEALDALPACEKLSLRLEGTGTIGATERTLATESSIAVRPWGIEGAAAASGNLTSDATISLEIDPTRKWKTRTLTIELRPSLQRLIVSEALGELDVIALRAGCLPPSTTADSAAELYALTHVLELVSASDSSATRDRERILARAETRITELVTAQRKDGGWSWSRGERPEAHVETSCLVAASLARAQATPGLSVPSTTRELATKYLNTAFRDASQQDDERKAMIVWALAVQRSGDFAAANRLHRARATLSPAALAYTALALVEMERAPMAAEVAEALVERLGVSGANPARAKVAGNTAWNAAPVEMTALAAYTLGRALPTSPALASLVDTLLAQRPWRPTRARGFALAALAWHAQHTAPTEDRSNVDIVVAGQPALHAALSSEAPGASLTLATPDDNSTKVRVDLKLTGGGHPHYVAVLRGFSDDTRPRDDDSLRIPEQRELAAPPVYRGHEIQTGFSVTRNVREWTNTVEHLALGSSAICRVQTFGVPRDAQDVASADYLVLEVPIPAGTRLLEDSVSGTAASWRLEGGKLVVELGQRPWTETIEFRLLGTLPGRYRVLPAILRSAYDPSRWAVGRAHDFEVLARGETSSDKYEPTPDQLFHLGRATFAAGEHARARTLLEKLYESYGAELSEQALRDAAETLLHLAIERDDARAIVRFFEVLKEKNPELTVPFEEILAVGAAYRKLDEHERALLIFKATIEETFGKDLKVVGALDAAQNADAALQTFARLLRDYPDFPGVLEAQLALSDRLLKLAPTASENASLRRAGRDRAALTRDGVQLLQRFLAMHPRDPLAPDAGLNLVNAYLSIEDYDRAADLSREFAEVYLKSSSADSFLYTAAVADWYRGDEANAQVMLTAISEASFTDASGVERHSPNRDLAVYILAQIHHARQEFKTAAEYYERVQHLFADARESLLTLREKTITLPEVTSARPGEKVEILLSHRNVARAEVLVYPVDLMTLYLREKTLAHVADVELAGISPTLRFQVELGKDAEMRARDEKIALDLKEPGAYLVIARGDEQHATGLVLVSDLELDVREDAAVGRMRIQVLRRSNSSFVRGADVKVVGSSRPTIVAGTTDPRGLFVADGVLGTSTVIARLGERQYAFFRGARALGQPVANKSQLPGPATGGPSGPPDSQSYFKNVSAQNDMSQTTRLNRLNEEIQRDRNGVQVKQVK